MPEAPHSADEAVRLAALHRLNILITALEERFDRITRTAARQTDVPLALISLVDADRQRFKSCLGLLDLDIPRTISFCSHAIHLDEPLVTHDAQTDPRFASNPLVIGEPFIRFDASQPLVGPDANKLGTVENNRQVVEALGRTIVAKPLTPEEHASAISTRLCGRQAE